MATRREKTIMFQVEVKPPVKTANRVTEVSIIEAAIKMDRITGIKVLSKDGIAILLNLIRSPISNTII